MNNDIDKLKILSNKLNIIENNNKKIKLLKNELNSAQETFSINMKNKIRELYTESEKKLKKDIPGAPSFIEEMNSLKIKNNFTDIKKWLKETEKISQHNFNEEFINYQNFFEKINVELEKNAIESVNIRENNNEQINEYKNKINGQIEDKYKEIENLRDECIKLNILSEKYFFLTDNIIDILLNNRADDIQSALNLAIEDKRQEDYYDYQREILREQRDIQREIEEREIEHQWEMERAAREQESLLKKQIELQKKEIENRSREEATQRMQAQYQERQARKKERELEMQRWKAEEKAKKEEQYRRQSAIYRAQQVLDHSKDPIERALAKDTINKNR